MDCPKCGTKSSDTLSCSQCGIVFSKFESSQSQKIHVERQKKLEELNLPHHAVWWVELGFPILAFALSPILFWMFPSLMWATSMWIHEFGHAFAGWFGGVAATPFLGWTSLSSGRSWMVTICFTALIALLGYLSWKKQSYFLVATFVCMFLAQIYFRFFVTYGELQWMFSYMGIGGEFWISTWFLIAYHHRFPEETYWRMLRYPVVFAGAFTFYHIFHLWLGVQAGRRDIPWGSLWGDSGDMDVLRDEWLWTPQMITSSYVKLGYICLAIMISHYLFQVVRKMMKRTT